MGRLTEGEAALILCIVGIKRKSDTIYPTIEESLCYMHTGSLSYLPLCWEETKEIVESQMKLLL